MLGIEFLSSRTRARTWALRTNGQTTSPMHTIRASWWFVLWVSTDAHSVDVIHPEWSNLPSWKIFLRALPPPQSSNCYAVQVRTGMTEVSKAPQVILRFGQGWGGWEILLHTNIDFDVYTLVRISKVAQSATKALSEIPTPEIPKSLVSSFLLCLKNEGFNETIMGPLVCWGIRLQFKLFSNAHKNE